MHWSLYLRLDQSTQKGLQVLSLFTYMEYQKPAWLEALYTQNFFVECSYHENTKKNEKNICCLDCCTSICAHCLPLHRFHRLLQVRRYVYHDVVRLEDLEKLIDCSNVQAYTINRAKVVFIKKRPQNRQFKGSVNYCASCDRSLQEPFIHCSLGCKVDFVLKHHKDISPYLRTCESLQLSSDFLMAQEIGFDEMSGCSAGGSRENTSTDMACTETVRKKHSGWNVYCAGFMGSKVSDADTATSMSSSRRKGIPHRSPLC